jgi:predicted N-formylglutamate amidohydrolase
MKTHMKLPLVTIPPLARPAAAPLDAPFVRYNADALSPLVLACDHASAAIPPEYGRLGLGDADLARHIALDIGAARLTETLAGRLGVTALMAAFSRLLIDPNRGPGEPTLIPETSDGTVIPGNLELSDGERAARIAKFHECYHQAVAQAMVKRQDSGVIPAFIGVHSFTPSMRDGRPRPWEIALLWNRDDRLARYMVGWLRERTDFTVGENEPYSGAVAGYSMDRHGGHMGRPNVVIEIRQDLIADDAGIRDWTEVLARMLEDTEAALSPFAEMPISHS